MSGRHRDRRRFTAVLVAAVVAVLTVGGAMVVRRQLSTEECPRRTDLTVAAAPEIAGRVRDAAAAWSRRDGVCVTVTVADGRPSDVAAAVAAEHRVDLTGLGRADGTAELPDVWLPDSSVWLARLAAVAPGFRPTVQNSVASSPVVLAMPTPTARSLHWDTGTVTWRQVLDGVVGRDQLRTGMAEPTQDAAGLAALSTLSAAASTTTDAQNVTTAALRAVAAVGSTLREDLVAKLPESKADAAAVTALDAVAIPESEVLRYNAAGPPVPLTVVDVRPAPAPMDYPFALMPGIDPAKSEAAEGLRAVLSAPPFQATLNGSGLRVPPAAGRAGNLDLAAVDRLLATWTVVTGPARMLAVIDVSGSMLRTVPTAGDATRIQLTVQTARQGLSLLDNTWSLGLWVFAARLDGNVDHRELVPIGPLSSRRPQLLSALAGIRATNGTNTGLYDTVFNAYRAVQDDWKPGQANSVVLFTDGVGNNDPDGGLTEGALLEKLKQTADPRRPVQMVLIGIGDEVRQKDLERIATATGNGSAFVAEDPAKIGEIFLKAVARRPVGRQ